VKASDCGQSWQLSDIRDQLCIARS
jgi:hypothetical protein